MSLGKREVNLDYHVDPGESPEYYIVIQLLWFLKLGFGFISTGPENMF